MSRQCLRVLSYEAADRVFESPPTSQRLGVFRGPPGVPREHFLLISAYGDDGLSG